MIIINSDKKKEIISKYNSTSQFYDKRYSKIQYEKYEIILKNFDFKSKVILDAGCGTGLLFFSLFLKNEIFYYVATDISLKMLKIFHLKLIELSNKKFQRRLNLILSDLENLPFRNSIFHSVFAPTSLQNLPSIQKGIEEIIKVAKKNADLKLTILKKKLDLNKLKSFLKSRINILEIFNINTIEDVIIQGKVMKV